MEILLRLINIFLGGMCCNRSARRFYTEVPRGQQRHSERKRQNNGSEVHASTDEGDYSWAYEENESKFFVLNGGDEDTHYLRGNRFRFGE